MGAKSAKDLIVYQAAFNLAMDIFIISQSWPKDEKFSLIDQIRKSSRSVCANLREAWAKRRYEAYFVSKLSDCDGENSETDTWLDFAKACNYITDDQHRRLANECKSIEAMLGSMINNPTPFLLQ